MTANDAKIDKKPQRFIEHIESKSPAIDDEDEKIPVIIDLRPSWGAAAFTATFTSILISPILVVVALPLGIALQLLHIKLTHRETQLVIGFMAVLLWLGVFLHGYWPRPYIGMRRKRDIPKETN